MTAWVFEKTTQQVGNTGQVKAVYSTGQQFSLIARGLANLRGKDSGTLQDWGNKLEEYHYLRVKTMLKIEEGDLIAKIRDADGSLYGEDPDLQFIVLGVTPTFDPFGSFIEYDVLCNKSEVHIKLPDSLAETADVTLMSSSEQSEVVVV
jgi:hypothetical protein